MADRTKLTEKQREILSYIAEMLRTTGYPPTIRQIGARFGITSTNGVRTHLRALQKKGYIKRSPYTSRGIELLSHGLKRALTKEVTEVPLVGRVAAGAPILAVENIEDILLMDRELFKGEEKLFALRVRGDSMVEAGILDGDHVIVRQQETAEIGDIIVALLGDEATVKIFRRGANGEIILVPANSRMQPIVAVPGQVEVKILGKVVGLLRTNIGQ